MFLSLLDNPVTRKDNYRLYVIFTMPQLRFLDFRRVKDAVISRDVDKLIYRNGKQLNPYLQPLQENLQSLPREFVHGLLFQRKAWRD